MANTEREELLIRMVRKLLSDENVLLGMVSSIVEIINMAGSNLNKIDTEIYPDLVIPKLVETLNSEFGQDIVSKPIDGNKNE